MSLLDYNNRQGHKLHDDLDNLYTLSGLPYIDGTWFWVDPTDGNDGKSGRTAAEAKLTLNAGIGLCTANYGDGVIVLRGGQEVTETVAFDVAGITVVAAGWGIAPISQGEYFSVYSAASFTDGPAATVTQPCRIMGLAFCSRDTGATFYDGAAMLIGGLATALPFGVHIISCRFPKWGLDNRIGIAVEGSSDVVIEHCGFEGVGADFDSGIYVQGATQNITIRNNLFRDCTYGVLFGAFAGGCPECIIKSNVFEGSKCLSAGNAATGIVCDNWMMTATDTGSYNDTVNNLNTLGLQFADQHYAE